MTQKNFEPYDPAALPDRYSIRAKGHERFLVCRESANISVRFERGMSVSAPAALKAPSETIYLDGAAQGDPFHNNQAIDAMIYSPAHFGEVVVVEEPARAGIGDNQLAIVCRSDRGICELEPHLRRLHGKRLGVIILQ
ncbi:MAG: hypothetical protein HXY45_08550 [Syntrophaceae bacterium]|nr:hypothetical protein [Syntrophaceae bacterium]